MSHDRRIVQAQVGQTWRMLTPFGAEQIMRIDRIAVDPATGRRRASGCCPTSGKKRLADVASLEKLLRGARLLVHADGTSADTTPRDNVPADLDDGPRQPVVREHHARGIPRRPISLFETRCTQLRARGLRPAAIARELKATPPQVETALRNVDDIRALQAALAAE
jgi:DNA-binding CsgD family transcriptional regulator